MLLIISSIK